MTALLIRLLLILLLVMAALLLAGLLSNQPRLTEPPGLQERLRIFLTRNVALTTPQATLPELEPRTYPAEPEQTFELARQSVQALGWRLEREDADEHRLHAVITTRWLRFKDDFVLRVVPASEGDGSEILIRSASRVGRGDLGANANHIRRFNAAMAERLRPSGQ